MTNLFYKLIISLLIYWLIEVEGGGYIPMAWENYQY